MEIKDIIEERFPDIDFPVLTSKGKRKISKEEKVYKAKKSKLRKDLTKEYTCNALPEHAKLFISKFIKENKLSMTIFDNFADAYFIAKYRLELEDNVS